MYVAEVTYCILNSSYNRGPCYIKALSWLCAFSTQVSIVKRKIKRLHHTRYESWMYPGLFTYIEFDYIH
jgi:hypothetical protein